MQDSFNNYTCNSSEFTFINEKIDSKIREINYNRQLIININHLEDFMSTKLKITQFLFGLEDELLDYLRRYKNLFIQNKELSDKCENYNSQIRNMDLKLFSAESLSNEYKNNINELINQINFLKEKNYSKDDYIRNLEEKLRIVEKNLNLKNNNYMESYSRRNNNNNEAINEIKNDYKNYGILNENNNQVHGGHGRKYDYDYDYDSKNINLEKLNYYEKYNLNDESNNNNNNVRNNNNNKPQGEFVKGFLKNYNNNTNLNLDNKKENLGVKVSSQNKNEKGYNFEDNDSNVGEKEEIPENDNKENLKQVNKAKELENEKVNILIKKIHFY